MQGTRQGTPPPAARRAINQGLGFKVQGITCRVYNRGVGSDTGAGLDDELQTRAVNVIVRGLGVWTWKDDRVQAHCQGLCLMSGSRVYA